MILRSAQLSSILNTAGSMLNTSGTSSSNIRTEVMQNALNQNVFPGISIFKSYLIVPSSELETVLATKLVQEATLKSEMFNKYWPNSSCCTEYDFFFWALTAFHLS